MSSRDEKARQALELRRAGVTFEQIAERLGYSSRANARAAVKEALARNQPDENDETRTLEVDRLDRLLFAIWPAAMKNDPKAVDQALKIAERRAKLLGLDVPSNPSQLQPPRPRLIWEDDPDDDTRPRPRAQGSE